MAGRGPNYRKKAALLLGEILFGNAAAGRLSWPSNPLSCLIEASVFFRAVSAATKKDMENRVMLSTKQGRAPYEDRVLWQYGAVPRM